MRGHVPGDLFCHVVVETTVNLTPRQRELLQEFESISQRDAARRATTRAAAPGSKR